MQFNRENLYDRILGCWIGKNIGGTLGAPFEWRRQINDVSFYTQELGGEPLPNDDLDIQLLWLIALEECGVRLDAHTLAEYWLLYVSPHWCEYGTAKINLRKGIAPPLSGMLDNPYKHSCGAFIRSEIWACIAPGFPQIAAAYAYQDAILDHGDGEGTFAAVFTAALESAAFVVDDIPQLVEIALAYIPPECGVYQAVRCVQASHDNGLTWREARDEVLRHFRGQTHGGMIELTSLEDRQQGFHEGILGWDVPSNIAILVLGLLYGEGDFARSLCTAVNCGEDTDCTGATLGALWGILHGASGIPEEWKTPIGNKIKTVCLNQGELGGFGGMLPQTVEAMTNRTLSVLHQVAAAHHLPIVISEDAPDQSGHPAGDMAVDANWRSQFYQHLGRPVYRFDFFDFAVDYQGQPTFCDESGKQIEIVPINKYRIPACFNVRILAPEGWQVEPSVCGTVAAPVPFYGGERGRLVFNLVPYEPTTPVTRFVVEITREGHAEIMLIPIVLLNHCLMFPSPDRP